MLFALLLTVHDILSPGPTATREHLQAVADSVCAPQRARIISSKVDRGQLRTQFVCVKR